MLLEGRVENRYAAEGGNVPVLPNGKKLLDSFSWYRPLESGGEIQLSEPEREKATEFLRVATEKSKDCQFQLLFRGERRDRLGRRLCRNKSVPWGKIASGLFYFGEKGKHFWKNSLRKMEEETDNKWKTIVNSINDLSAVSRESLLRHLTTILTLENTRSFREENSRF